MFKQVLDNDDDKDDFNVKGSEIEVKGYIYVSHLKKWYEPSLFVNWLGMTYNRSTTAKKESSRSHYENLLRTLRNDYLEALKGGNITPSLTRYIKNYPERVGDDVKEWYREASVMG